MEVPFAQVANCVLQDKSISLKAKGLFAYLYSKPNTWDFAIERIVKECKESERAVRSAIWELEEIGYLTRIKSSTGRVQYLLTFIKATLAKRQCGETLGLSNTNKSHSNKEKTVVVAKAPTAPINNKNMKIYAYDENRFSDDQEATIDYNTGEMYRGKPKEKISDELRDQAKLFFETYRDLFADLILKGVRPELATRSAKLLVPCYGALKRYGFDKLKTMLEIYMNEDNPYYKKQVWNIYTFLSNRVLLELDIKTQVQNGKTN